MVADLFVMLAAEISADFGQHCISQIFAFAAELERQGFNKEEINKASRRIAQEYLGQTAAVMMSPNASLGEKANAALGLGADVAQSGLRQLTGLLPINGGNAEEKVVDGDLPQQANNDLAAIISAIARLPREERQLVANQLQQITVLSTQFKIAQAVGAVDLAATKKAELQAVLEQTAVMAEQSKNRAAKDALLAIVSFGVMVAGIVMAASGFLAPLGVGLALAGAAGSGIFAKKYSADSKDAKRDAPLVEAVRTYHQSLS